MLGHVWTEWDSALRAMAAPEALLFQEMPGGGRLILSARGEPAFGAFTLSTSARITDELWLEDPTHAGLSSLEQLCATSGLAVVSGSTRGGILPTVAQAAPVSLAPEALRIGIGAYGTGITVYAVTAGSLTAQRDVADTAALPLGDISDALTLDIGPRSFGFAASARDTGIVSFRLMPDGVTLRDTALPDGVFTPNRLSDLEAISHAGQNYLFAADGGGSALSVFRVSKFGQLKHFDTIAHSSTFPLTNIRELAAILHDGRIIIVAGGGFSGLSLFELTHRKTLRPIETFIADPETSGRMQDISDILVQEIAGDTFIFVSDRKDDAISAFQLLPKETGALLLGGARSNTITGTNSNDILDGRKGQDVLYGEQGDDILYDGAGRDRLWGGEGADIFVFDDDGQRDRIMDFEITADRIDLSQLPRVTGLPNLKIIPKAWGARIDAAGEEIIIHSKDGASLMPEAFTADHFIF